jgi:hypothetical protein
VSSYGIHPHDPVLCVHSSIAEFLGIAPPTPNAAAALPLPAPDGVQTEDDVRRHQIQAELEHLEAEALRQELTFTGSSPFAQPLLQVLNIATERAHGTDPSTSAAGAPELRFVPPLMRPLLQPHATHPSYTHPPHTTSASPPEYQPPTIPSDAPPDTGAPPHRGTEGERAAESPTTAAASPRPSFEAAISAWQQRMESLQKSIEEQRAEKERRRKQRRRERGSTESR